MGDRRFRFRALALFTSGWAAFLLSGCFGSGIQSTIDPKSDATRIIQSLYGLVTWIDIGIFVVVFGFLIIAIVRFREKPGQGIPKQVHGHLGLEIIWTIIPAILLIFIAVPTWSGIF
ncbi:MAG: cytochrome B, partial [SAR324 cluster bacterium]|nr:cytochrome B [SAR324 cluster bacterium]